MSRFSEAEQLRILQSALQDCKISYARLRCRVCAWKALPGHKLRVRAYGTGTKNLMAGARHKDDEGVCCDKVGCDLSAC